MYKTSLAALVLVVGGLESVWAGGALYLKNRTVDTSLLSAIVADAVPGPGRRLRPGWSRVIVQYGSAAGRAAYSMADYVCRAEP